MRALPLLLKLAGGAGFRSSAHPAGPNEPSCLDLDIYLPFRLRNKDPYPYGNPYPCPYPWLRPAQCSLSSFPVFILILIRIQLSGFALVIILSLGVNWGGALAQIMYFWSLETNDGQIQRN